MKQFFISSLILVIGVLGLTVQAEAQARKPKVAVMMPEMIATPNMTAQQRGELAQFIQADIEAAFREIRTFDVYARDNTAALAQQRELLMAASSGSVDTSSLVEGDNPIVDFVILPVIRVARLDRQMNNVARGVWIAKDRGYVELSVRLLNVGTKQISSTSINQIEKVGKATNLPTNRPTAQDRLVDPRMTSELSRVVGLFVAKDTSFRIDPPTVVAFANGEVYIDKGPNSGLSAGDYFEVFAPGEDIIVDGIKLGSTETKIGLVIIDRFQAKLSIGKFVNTEPSATLSNQALKGSLMRPAQKPDIAAASGGAGQPGSQGAVNRY